MISRGEKTGQFYLITALILSVIMIGISITSNYSSANSNSDLNSLKKEIQIESARTIDYGINNKLGTAEIENSLSYLSQNYISNEKDKDLYFVYGTTNSVTVIGWQNEDNYVSIDGQEVTQTAGQFSNTITPSASNINLEINTNPYPIELKIGENFYFVIMQEKGGEKYVVTG